MTIPDGRIINLVLSALAAALVAGGGVAATTRDPWPICVAVVTSIGIAITQHLRQLPRDEWTDEKRANMVEAQAKTETK